MLADVSLWSHPLLLADSSWCSYRIQSPVLLQTGPSAPRLLSGPYAYYAAADLQAEQQLSSCWQKSQASSIPPHGSLYVPHGQPQSLPVSPCGQLAVQALLSAESLWRSCQHNMSNCPRPGTACSPGHRDLLPPSGPASASRRLTCFTLYSSSKLSEYQSRAQLVPNPKIFHKNSAAALWVKHVEGHSPSGLPSHGNTDFISNTICHQMAWVE